MAEKSASKDNKNAKILEPTFHFKSKHIKIGEDYTTDKIPVSELVLAGQLLADFPNFERFKARGFEKAQLLPGDNVTFSDDEQSLIATVPGYPKTHKSRAGSSMAGATVLSVEPLFIIPLDQMKATLAIHPPLPDGCSLQNVVLKDLLEEVGIVHGLNEDAIAAAVSYINQGDPEFNKIVIAEGRAVGNSSDAYLRFDIEIGPIAGTILEDGSIDFRDRRIMVGVNKGERIATKFPAVQGEPGINVFGEETPAPEGKDLKIKLLNDASFSQDTMYVTASKDGVLSVVNDNVIKVCSRQVIQGDIDFKTGNIDSRNSVTIRGSVQPGFLVTADGDLEISGQIMSTTIKSGGNTVIKGGITGNKTVIEADGDCDINFIEQGRIKCGGICVIRNQSYYSDISAGSHIRCMDNSKIMSGSLIAGGNISVGDVGSPDCRPSVIAAGVIADRLTLFDKLTKSVVEQQDEIIQWLQRYRGSSTSKKVRKMEQKLAETKILLLKVNMIPGTGKYSKAGASEDNSAEQGEDYINKGAIDIAKIKIDVRGTIYAGTKIQIGNRMLKLDKTVSARQFRLHANLKKILAKPIRK